MTEPKNSFTDFEPCDLEEAQNQERVVYGPVPFLVLLQALRMFKKVTIVARPANVDLNSTSAA